MRNDLINTSDLVMFKHARFVSHYEYETVNVAINKNHIISIEERPKLVSNNKTELFFDIFITPGETYMVYNKNWKSLNDILKYIKNY